MNSWRHLFIALLVLIMLLACGGVVMAGAESEELPPIPEEVAAVIGELPTSLDDLPEGFDLARLKEIHEAVDLEKVATELLESGSSTFSDGGFDWENPWMFIISEGTNTDVGVSLSAADNGQLTMKLDEALPNGGKYDGFVINLSVRGRHYYKQVSAYDVGTESEHIYNNTTQKLPSTDGWNYMLSDNKDGQFDFTVSSGTPYFRQWTIKFDEQGGIADNYYYSDEEESLPTEEEDHPVEELPPLPKEIADVVGELPTSLDDLPEGFDAAQFKAVYDAMDLEKVVSELLESGSSTFSDGGVAWDMPDLRFYLEGNVTFVGVSLSAADNGQMTVKLNDALPGDGEFDAYLFSMHSKDPDYVASVDAYNIGTPDESKSFNIYRMSYIKATDGKEWCIRLDKDAFRIHFTLSTNNPYRQWTIYFNEQGEIVDTDYYGDEEEAQPAEAEQPTYTVDDYIGTWYMKLAYMSERGVTVDPVAQFGYDPYKNTLTIEPGKVTIENEDSSEPSIFEGELKFVGDTLCVMMDEENYYSNARFLIFDNEDGRFLTWLPSSGDIYYYSSEAPKDPGKVHKDKATVKAAQQALNDAGYECGKPDGSAGKKTKAAITAYQTDKGLTVTGTVTDELLRSLGIE